MLFEGIILRLAPPSGSGSPNSSSFDNSNDFLDANWNPTGLRTVSLWLKTSGSQGAMVNQRFDGSEQQGAWYVAQEGQVDFTVYTGSGSSQTIFSDSALNDDAWHHVVVTVDSVDGMAMWVDGVKQTDTNAQTQSLGTADEDIHLGRLGNNGAWDWYYGGEIDEVKFFDKALNSTEVDNLYNTGSTIEAEAVDSVTLVSPANGTITNNDTQDFTYKPDFESADINVCRLINNQSNTYLDNVVRSFKLDGNANDSAKNMGGSESSSVSYTTGIIDDAADMEPTDALITVPDSTDIRFNETQSFTVSAWIKTAGYQDEGSTFNGIVGKGILGGSGTDNGMYGLYLDSNSHMEFYIGDTSNGLTTGEPADESRWRHLVGTANSTEMVIFLDGERKSKRIRNLAADTTSDLFIGRDENSGRPFNGSVDDVNIFSKKLSDEEVKDLYNRTFPTYPFNDAANDTNPINNTNNTFSDVGPFAEGEHEYLTYCQDFNGTAVTSSTQIIEMDFTEPQFTVDDSSVWKGQYAVLTGKTNGPNLNGQINVTDPNGNLWSFNASIPGQRVIYNITEIDNSSLTFNLDHNVTDLSPGSYNLSIYAADGHTAKKIPNYDYVRMPFSNAIKYDFDGNGLKDEKHVKINVEGTSGTIKTKKLKDRYTWTYNPGLFSPKNRVVQHLTSTHEIVPVQNSEYKAHFVIPNLEKWVDFELQKPTGKETYAVERLSPKHYKITITNVDVSNPLTFRSIGDLNTNQQNYTFTVINVTTTHTEPVIDTTQSTIVLNFTNANQSYDVTANLTYDSTTYTSPTKTQTSNYISFEQIITHNDTTSTNNTYQWNFTLTGPNGQTHTNTTTPETQEVLVYDLVECSAGQQPIANFSMFNEVSRDPVTASIEASFQTVLATSSATGTSKEFGFDLNGETSYALCRTPETINLNVSTEAFTYTNTESTIRNFELSNDLWSNTTTFYDLYLINESLSSDVILEVRDTNDEEVPDALITVNRLYPANNTFVPVEVARTDFTGKTQVDLILDDVFYSFTIELDNVIVKEVPASRIFSTSLLFVIDTEDQLPSIENKVFWDIQPPSPIRPEPINFSFQAAPVNDFVVEWFAIQSHFNNTAYVTNSTSNTGGTVRVAVPINETGLVPNRYFIKMQGEDLFVFNRTYVVTEAPGNNSITGFTEELNTIFPPWVRAILAVIISLMAALLVGAFVGAEGAALTAVLTQLFFALPVIGWIPFFMFVVQIIIIVGLYMVFGREVA